MIQYNAEISAGSLMPLESRRLAELLQTFPDETAWNKAIETDNVLQKKTPATARRQARLIKRRLITMAHDFKTNDRVHHVNYFVQPETVRAIRSSLEIGGR